MYELLQGLRDSIDLSPGTLAVAGIGIGMMLVVFGLSSAFAARDAALDRMARQGMAHRINSRDAGLLRHDSATPTGLMKGLIPQDRHQRGEVQRDLAMAGFAGPEAVRNYYLLRLTLGVLVPAAVFALVWASRSGHLALPERIETLVAGFSRLRIAQIVMIMVAAGFFGPAWWLRGRVAERQQAISESFPNTLDLIQISVEAGLGFDAAMIRVGNELERTAPEMSQELLVTQREIQAGRNRDQALTDMARRTGVDEVMAFANVVLQSIQFGSPIAGTLTAYAKEMRNARELRAQEMANKLPVKMSGVMAFLMLPALLLLTLGPVIIRYVRLMHG